MNTSARDLVIAYLLHEVDLAQLEEWLTTATWNADVVMDDDTGIAFDAQIVLAEHARGHRSDDDLERTLRRLVMRAHIGTPPAVATTANAITERSIRWAQPQIDGAGKRSAAAPA